MSEERYTNLKNILETNMQRKNLWQGFAVVAAAVGLVRLHQAGDFKLKEYDATDIGDLLLSVFDRSYQAMQADPKEPNALVCARKEPYSARSLRYF